MEMSKCRCLNLELIPKLSVSSYDLVLLLEGDILIFFLLSESYFTIDRVKEITEKLKLLLYQVTCSQPDCRTEMEKVKQF